MFTEQREQSSRTKQSLLIIHFFGFFAYEGVQNNFPHNSSKNPFATRDSGWKI